MSDPMSADTIGEFLAAYRGLRGLTQAQLAERLGFVQSTVGNWEAGRHDPRKHWQALSGALAIPVSAWAFAFGLPQRKAA